MLPTLMPLPMPSAPHCFLTVAWIPTFGLRYRVACSVHRLARCTSKAYHRIMFTVATTHRFESDAARIWSEAEIAELITQVAKNPHKGDLIPGTGGLRKLRWAMQGTAKRGGARVITYAIDRDGKVGC